MLSKNKNKVLTFLLSDMLLTNFYIKPSFSLTQKSRGLLAIVGRPVRRPARQLVIVRRAIFYVSKVLWIIGFKTGLRVILFV